MLEDHIWTQSSRMVIFNLIWPILETISAFMNLEFKPIIWFAMVLTMAIQIRNVIKEKTPTFATSICNEDSNLRQEEGTVWLLVTNHTKPHNLNIIPMQLEMEKWPQITFKTFLALLAGRPWLSWELTPWEDYMFVLLCFAIYGILRVASCSTINITSTE